MNETQITTLTPEHKAIVAKLRYMARQYTNGSYARGGSPSGKHYLDEAADAIEELAQRAAVPVGEVEPVDGFKAAFETSVDYLGKVNQTEREFRRLLCVVYAGGRAYMDDGEAQDNRANPCIDFLRDAPKVIQQKMQQRSLAATPPATPEGWRIVPVEPTPEMLAASQYPVWAADAYAAMLAAAPQPGDK